MTELASLNVNYPTMEQVVRELGDRDYGLTKAPFSNFRVHIKPVDVLDPDNFLQRQIDKKANDGGIALSYGGFLGLDIAAASNCTGVLLFDLNPNQKHFWNAVIELIKECKTAEEFRNHFSRIKSGFNIRIPPAQPAFASSPERLDYTLSFEKDENTYQHVRNWALNDMMAATDMDVVDAERYQKLKAAMGDHRVKLVFLSNISEFHNLNNIFESDSDFYGRKIGDGDGNKMLKNIEIIGDGSTIVIEEKLRPSGSGVSDLVERTLSDIIKGHSK